MNPLKYLSTHSTRLERLVGAAKLEAVSRAMANWYGPPIAMGDVPGAVWACAGGDFRGPVRAGQLASLRDFAEQRLKRIARNFALRQQFCANAGFSSLSDLIAEATTNGKNREFYFNKAGVAADAAGASVSLWGLGNIPAAGSGTSAAAPAGSAPTDATTGAFPFTNPTGGDTQHLVGARVYATTDDKILLMYDRLFEVTKTMNSTTAESVTGVPTRYQSSTPGDADYAGGNFLMPEVGGTVLANTAHNHDAIKYRNQAGTDAQTAPSAAGVAAMNARGIDIAPNSGWFIPLASGDTGAMDLHEIKMDALVATGVLNWVIGHPIALWTLPILGRLQEMDHIMTAFNLVRIFDDAALAFVLVNQASTGATTVTGHFKTVAG